MKKMILGVMVAVLIIAGCSQKQIVQEKSINTGTNTKPPKVVVEEKVIPPKQNSSNGIVESTVTIINPNIEVNMKQATIKTSKGSIKLELFVEDAPKTVENFVKLAESGFYDGIKFHRVIPDFMIQAGDPLTKDDSKKNLWGTGGPGYTFEDEINKNKNIRGAISMANSGPNTNGSQFFLITKNATPWLDGNHTVFGRITEGLDVIDEISLVEVEAPGLIDRPINDIIIESITIESK